MKAKVDPDLCIGCGLCASTCPEAFQLRDDKSFVYADPVPPGAEETCKRAAEECPAKAIKTE